MRIDEFDVEISEDARPLTVDEQAAVSAVDLATGAITFEGTGAPDDLRSDDIISIAPTQGAPSGALRRVTDVARLGSDVTVQTEDAQLTDLVTRMPPSEGTIAMCAVDTTVADLGDGVTLDGIEDGGSSCSAPPAPGTRRARVARTAGAVVIKAPKISLTANMAGSWEPKSGVKVSWGLEGKVSAGPVIEVGIDTNWYGKVTGYRAAGGTDWDVSLKAYFKVAGRLDTQSKKKQELAKVVRTFGGFIGPIPVWADLEGKLVAETGVEGSVELAYVTERTGRDLLGITNTSAENMAPKAYSSTATTQGRFAQVEATGKVLSSVAAEVQLSLYSVGGPFLDLGTKGELGISWSSSGGASCRIEAGPFLKLGLQTSDLVEKLTGGLQGGVDFEVFRRVIDLDLCPSGTDLDPDNPPDPDPEPEPDPDLPPGAGSFVWLTRDRSFLDARLDDRGTTLLTDSDCYAYLATQTTSRINTTDGNICFDNELTDDGQHVFYGSYGTRGTAPPGQPICPDPLGYISRWDRATGTSSIVDLGGVCWYQGFRVSGNGRYILFIQGSGGSPTKLVVRDTATSSNTTIATAGQGCTPWPIEVANDGQTVAYGGCVVRTRPDGTQDTAPAVYRWTADNGASLIGGGQESTCQVGRSTASGDVSAVFFVEYRSQRIDGTLRCLATEITKWSAGSGATTVLTVPATSSLAGSISVSTNGERAVVGYADGTPRAFLLQNGEPPTDLSTLGLPTDVRKPTISGDGNSIAFTTTEQLTLADPNDTPRDWYLTGVPAPAP